MYGRNCLEIAGVWIDDAYKADTKSVTVKAQSDAYFSMTASTPGFWSPIELSMPAGVSVTRGGSLPNRGWSVVPLQQMAPSRPISTTSPYSMP